MTRKIYKINNIKIGDVFSQLTILAELPERYHTYKQYACICSCGNHTTATSVALNHGLKHSCGCLQKKVAAITGKNTYKGQISIINSLIQDYKKSSHKRNIEYALDIDLFIQLTSDNCYYCGSMPNNEYKNGGCRDIYIYNGIDRVNNNLGYIKGNCVSCCKQCNYAKRVMSHDNFVQWIHKTHEYLKGKGL